MCPHQRPTGQSAVIRPELSHNRTLTLTSNLFRPRVLVRTSLPIHPTLTKMTFIQFIDFTAAFDIVIPRQLLGKPSLLDSNTSLFNLFMDFLTRRPPTRQDRHHHLQHQLTELQRSPGMCPQPTDFYATDSLMCCKSAPQSSSHYSNGSHQHAGRRWSSSQTGAGTTIFLLSTSIKQKRWLSTLGEPVAITLHGTSTEQMWRESEAACSSVWCDRPFLDPPEHLCYQTSPAVSSYYTVVNVIG